jgi:F0F1-type ATP synthase membrane subunit b/b'
MQDMIAQSQFVMKYAFVLLVGFVTAFVLTPLVGRLARKIG